MWLDEDDKSKDDLMVGGPRAALRQDTNRQIRVADVGVPLGVAGVPKNVLILPEGIKGGLSREETFQFCLLHSSPPPLPKQ